MYWIIRANMAVKMNIASDIIILVARKAGVASTLKMITEGITCQRS